MSSKKLMLLLVLVVSQATAFNARSATPIFKGADLARAVCNTPEVKKMLKDAFIKHADNFKATRRIDSLNEISVYPSETNRRSHVTFNVRDFGFMDLADSTSEVHFNGISINSVYSEPNAKQKKPRGSDCSVYVIAESPHTNEKMVTTIKVFVQFGL